MQSLLHKEFWKFRCVTVSDVDLLNHTNSSEADLWKRLSLVCRHRIQSNELKNN